MTRNAPPVPLLLLALCLGSFIAGCTDTGDQGGQDANGATEPPEQDIAGAPLDIIEDAQPNPDIIEDAQPDSDVIEDAQPNPDIIEDVQDGVGTCEPQCDGKECGDDGCGDVCGTCSADTPICIDNLCVSADGLCPEAHIEVLEGTLVVPQTTLHLDGTQSGGNGISIVSYQWAVEQPEGSTSVFLPNSTYSTPHFVANVAGAYTFELSVWDELGNKSCEPAVVVVVVQPEAGIHIELTWDTPGDANQVDEGPEAGADMDLHFAHWFATGADWDGDGAPDGWFNQPFDCFWFNAHPNWGNFDPAIQDDPGLDLDDLDGTGPENLNLQMPEEGPTPDDRYKVGVHYWNDHGFGPSQPAVRIYISGELAYTAEAPPMETADMWFVAEISWPDGAVIPTNNEDGSPKVLPNYSSPFNMP